MTRDRSFDAAWTAVADVHGWLTQHQARLLHSASEATRSGDTIVEIGSFRGRSAIVLAMAAPDGVEVVAIEPHAGNDRGPQEIEGYAAAASVDFELFHANLAQAGVTDRVRHVQLFSHEALGAIAGDIAVLYVDGAHRYGPARLPRWPRCGWPARLPAIDPFRGRNEQDELTLPEIAARAYSDSASITRKQQLAARSNLHYRLVEVAMMLMLPLLAIALAVPPKRSNSGLGIFVGIVMVVTYHKINQYAEDAGAQGRLVPELALWLPFLGLVALIGWMYHVIAHRPGGQPIGALENGVNYLTKLLRRMMPQSRIEREQAASAA